MVSISLPVSFLSSLFLLSFFLAPKSGILHFNFSPSHSQGKLKPKIFIWNQSDVSLMYPVWCFFSQKPLCYSRCSFCHSLPNQCPPPKKNCCLDEKQFPVNWWQTLIDCKHIRQQQIAIQLQEYCISYRLRLSPFATRNYSPFCTIRIESWVQFLSSWWVRIPQSWSQTGTQSTYKLKYRIPEVNTRLSSFTEAPIKAYLLLHSSPWTDCCHTTHYWLATYTLANWTFRT